MRRLFFASLFTLSAFAPSVGSVSTHPDSELGADGLPDHQTRGTVATASTSGRPGPRAGIEASGEDPLGLDTIPPTVAITAPWPGQTVSGTFLIQTSSADNIRVASVLFYLDGSIAGGDVAPPYDFAWDTTLVSRGSHTLFAEAYDLFGNKGSSAAVPVTVSNVDTVPPSAPANLTATAAVPTRVDLAWTAASDNVGVAGYTVLRNGGSIGTASTTSYADTTVSGGTTYTYVVKARDAAGNMSGPSNAATVTTPGSPTSITFAAAGDHGAGAAAEASLNALDSSGANFYLALGDLDYGNSPSPAAWCDFVKSRLPTLGPSFPFELVSGNHENSTIGSYAACLPDRLNSTPGPNSQYAAEYYFDYPAGAPLVRVVMTAPDLTIAGQTYVYAAGDTHYTWLAGVINGARTAGIPWVVVGMHKVCLSTGSKSCEIGADLMNLLVQKKVDLVLQAHDHNYQRGKQLSLNPGTCPAVPVNAYDADCVSDAGADGVYTKGAGALFVIDGTFGRGFYSVKPSDSEAGYFAKINATTNGFTKYTVSADRIDVQFVNSNGSFTDSFSIRR